MLNVRLRVYPELIAHKQALSTIEWYVTMFNLFLDKILFRKSHTDEGFIIFQINQKLKSAGRIYQENIIFVSNIDWVIER